MAAIKSKSTGASEIPLLFTIVSSNRHELLITSTLTSYSDLTSEIATLASTSPNCEEFMAKYKKKGAEEKVKSMKVKWGVSTGRDAIWPKATIVTEENLEAVLLMMERGGGVGRDVLEVVLEGMGEEEGK
ncbi:hypothetical protein FKW77_002717 [Venturia effusa]|uniref:Uncharacterized protein n=1 Tax=Venturia effusa TaxID=50376 RepID=A0A517L0Y6_9PEZI|nr:hypothetical protein FKW77_002717 [Venturia effusa]